MMIEIYFANSVLNLSNSQIALGIGLTSRAGRYWDSQPPFKHYSLINKFIIDTIDQLPSSSSHERYYKIKLHELYLDYRKGKHNGA